MAWEEVWEKVFREQEWGKYPGEDLIRFTARNFYQVPDRSAIKILEVGCGPGANLWYLAREGFSVFGVDGSETAIRQARERLDKECPNWQGQLVVADIMRIPFADDYFDAVIDNEAVCCNLFKNARTIYSEMWRVCKSAGKLHVRTFSTGSWGDHTGTNLEGNAWIVAEGPSLGQGCSRFTSLNELGQLLKGFDLEEIELLTRSVDGRQHTIIEWIIDGVKVRAS
ncbi:MAG: class I SAM-dependent methyltransferase [Ignavibacteriales bacterium]